MKQWLLTRYRIFRRLKFRYTRLLVYVGFRLWLRKVANKEKLPQSGPVLIVSNHTSYFDWSVLSAVYNKKYVVFLAKKDLLNRMFVNWLMNLNIIIYVDEDKADFSYFRKILKKLKEGHVVVIYPEGTRSKTGKMIMPKIGFVKLAMMANVPVVPIAMKGAYEILPYNKRIPRFRKCDVVVGDPIRIDENEPMFKDIFKNDSGEKGLIDEGMEKIAIKIMNVVAGMSGQQWQEDVMEKIKDMNVDIKNMGKKNKNPDIK